MKSKYFLLLTLLCFISLQQVDAATWQNGDISIASQAPLPGKSTHGYVEYSFILQNKSFSQKHQVTLEIPNNDMGYGTRIYPLSRTVNIPPGTKVKLKLYQPHIGMRGHQIRVLVDGREQSYQNTLTFSPSNFTGYGNDSEILITKAAMSKNPPALESGSGNVYILANIPVRDWSDNWLAFSRYSLIVTAQEDFEKMSVGTRIALINYAECGGILLVSGELGALNSWQRFKKTIGVWNVYSAGFGKIVTTSKAFDKIPRTKWNQIYRMASSVKAVLKTDATVNSANSNFPVVKKLNISPGIIFSIMFVFAILIGPINIYILSKKKRKIWLLWTVPAGALLFTLVLLAYALSSETWGGHTRSRTLTVLNENTRRAVSLGRLAYFYPIPPSGGLRFSPYTEVGTYGINRSSRIYAVDWTNGQHLKSGWLIAKTPCQLMVRKNEPRRERLKVNRHNGQITITNGLGTHIEKLTLWDFDKKPYTALNIKPGAKVELTVEISNKKAFRTDSLNASFTHFTELNTNDFKLIPGSYVATLRRNPFVEPGRKFSANHKDQATLVGIMRKEVSK
jgi:hypothetical protein